MTVVCQDIAKDESACLIIHPVAAQLGGMPIVLISLAGSERLWARVEGGLTLTEVSREFSLLVRAIPPLHDLFVVEDIRASARFTAQPLATSDLQLRFYAGVPLITHEDYVMGALWLMDEVPRELTEAQREALRTLSRVMVTEMGLRQTVKVQLQLLAERDQVQARYRRGANTAHPPDRT